MFKEGLRHFMVGTERRVKAFQNASSKVFAAINRSRDV